MNLLYFIALQLVYQGSAEAIAMAGLNGCLCEGVEVELACESFDQ